MNFEIKKKFSNTIKFLRRKVYQTNWVNLRNVNPISDDFGWSRGKPIDRFYIEKFLNTNRSKINGDCGEISERKYLNLYKNDLIKSAKIFDINLENKSADIYGDLADLKQLHENLFDCFVCTQVLNFIFDYSSAIIGLHKILKPGGYLLLTVAGPTVHISKYDDIKWGDYWRFTETSALKSFEKVFGKGNVKVEAYGNVLTSTAMMQGLSSNELTKDELNYKDTSYPSVITVIAKKI